MISGNEKILASEIAAYYRHPESIPYDKKELLNEAKAKNKDLHYQALEINRCIWNKIRG